MSRLSPRSDALRALFARSENRCAFPGCTAVLVNERNQFVGQICHIEAAAEEGERFSPSQSDEQRRSYDNLLLLCYQHHVGTNDVFAYPVERMRAMKADHESAFGQKPYKIDESLLYKVAAEMEDYWHRVDTIHRFHHAASDHAIEINAAATFLQVADQMRCLVDDLRSIQAFLIESDRKRYGKTYFALGHIDTEPVCAPPASSGPNDFEVLYIGFTNTITKISVVLTQMKIKSLEEFTKLNPADVHARQRLAQQKEEFAQMAAIAGHVD